MSEPPPSIAPPPRLLRWRWAAPVTLVLIALGALQAWVSDDAYITFRVVDNVLNGQGLVWNGGYRVQTYTHPLWFALMVPVAGLSGEVFWTSIALGLLVSAVYVFLAFWHGRSHWAALAVACLLAASPSFVDFETSGLENPLTHVLVFGVAFVLARRGPAAQVGPLALLVSLLYLTRPDAALFAGVPLVVAFARSPNKKRAFGSILSGLMPLLAWEVCSILYYGTPVPNTALAKLGADLPMHNRWDMGLNYVARFADRDWSGAALVMGGCAYLTTRRHLRPLAAAIVVHVAYVVYIGGDFMEGRFFTPAIAAAAAGVLLAAPPTLRGARYAAAACAVLFACGGLVSMHRDNAPWREEEAVGDHTRDFYGVTDERAQYRQHLSVQAMRAGHGPGTYPGAVDGARMRTMGRRVVVERAQVGVFGYYAGPDVHVIDAFAVSDPLLARLPTFYMARYRAGHLPRGVSRAYVRAAQANAPAFDDPGRRASPALAALYEHVHRVVTAPIMDGDRLNSVWHLLTGGGRSDIDPEWLEYRHYGAPIVPLGVEGLPAPARIPDGGARLGFDPPLGGDRIELAVTHEEPVILRLYRDGELLLEDIGPPERVIPLPESATGADRGYLLPVREYRPDRRALRLVLHP